MTHTFSTFPTMVSWLILLQLANQCFSFGFEFASFGPNSRGLIDLEHDAFLDCDGLELSRNQANRAAIADSYGRASYGGPVLLWHPKTRRLADFTARFTFSVRAFDVDDRSESGGGLAFFLAPFGSRQASDSSGESLGLFARRSGRPNPVLDRFVAVEFDTFKDVMDPSPQHVGIDIDSVISVASFRWTNGSMRDGRVATSWVSYNATTHNLTVFLTYDQNPSFSERYLVLWCNLDLRDYLPGWIRVGFTASTGKAVETHTVHSWSFNSTLESLLFNNNNNTSTPSLCSTRATKKVKAGFVMGLGVKCGVAIVIVFGLGVTWLVCARKRCLLGRELFDGVEENYFDVASVIDDDGSELEIGAAAAMGPKRFSYTELRLATRGFSEEGKLGEGGFGDVYKGSFPGPGGEKLVAVKRISKASRQGRKEYFAEVKIMSRLRHRNLVQLVGWCHRRGEFLLVYEYLPNRSLDSHRFLPWATRHKIALGLASALVYLHEGCEKCVLHRDVKSSNVMLDADFNAKLGDFGLARLVDHEYSLHTVAFAGTIGYIAPECVETGKSTKESDVYSFGVVALEICCGRRPAVADGETVRAGLVRWAWELYKRGKLLEGVDERLGSEFDVKEIECLMVAGLWCCHSDPELRPSIKQALSVLTFEAPFPDNLVATQFACH